ncbi:MAG: ATP-grasp domain-containing protein [Capsulimonas sp.]|uniref:ATP-grasp domain-containing protein n=1 Tax=Capsulimonas sp. TaxID=2494211 RepID=UPI003267057B
MRLLFPAHPLDPRSPDPSYADEAAAGEELGLSRSLINFEALVYEDDPARAVARVAPSEGEEIAVYRGWMMTPSQYASLSDALADRGVRLVNSPAEYRHCHYLPESYEAIEGQTPATVWLRWNGTASMDTVMELLRPFGARPIIVKDYVKSRKHEWDEACFIPDASDRTGAARVVERFLELQGSDLNEGLVFREFVEFEPLTTHSQSGMPLTQEFRLFFLDGAPIVVSQYWNEGDYGALRPPIEHFTNIALRVQSRFFTMDVAKRRGGEWMVMELGDAQVSQLPEGASTMEFIAALGQLT